MKNLNTIISLLFLVAAGSLVQSCTWFKKAGAATPTTGGIPKPGDEDMTYKMDTLEWRDDTSKPPIKTDGKEEPYEPPVATDNTGTTTHLKETYDISLLLPFYSDRFSDSSGMYSKSNFALDYYAGLKLALDSLGKTGLKLNFNVWDTQKDYLNFQDLLNKKEIRNADVIIGPAEKDNITVATNFVKGKNITLLSPYYPSLDLAADCPNFVQVNPSLKAHCEAITRHINARYKSDQVVMVCREKDNEASRFSYFQNALTAKGGSSRFQEFIVADESATLFKTDVASLYKTGTTVFVIPSWQESFVLAFLRKINETKGNREVIVYGMPQWLDNAQLSLDYYNSLQLRICTANFVHQDDPRAKAFRKAFFNKYGKIPGKDAFLGYDTMLMLGRMLGKYGTGFQQKFSIDRIKGLQSGFYFQPVASQTATTGSDRFDQVMKYENQYLFILKMEDYVLISDE